VPAKGRLLKQIQIKPDGALHRAPENRAAYDHISETPVYAAIA
jgi:hypothetical protein